MMKKNTTINERILQIIESQCDGNKKKFADRIGFKPQVVSNIVSGRKSKPSFDVLNAIKTSFVDISSEWLLMGDEEMFKREKQESSIQEQSNKEQYEDTIRLLTSVIKDKEEIIKNKDEIIRLLKESKKDGLELLPVSMVEEDESKGYSKNTPIIENTEQNQRTTPSKLT